MEHDDYTTTDAAIDSAITCRCLDCRAFFEISHEALRRDSRETPVECPNCEGTDYEIDPAPEAGAQGRRAA